MGEVGEKFLDVWAQAQRNHHQYSQTGSKEEDIRFFSLGLAGEAGEVANFVKKRWRDGDAHLTDLRKECADVFAYNIMLADALGMSPLDLLETVAGKQQAFIAKMQARGKEGCVYVFNGCAHPDLCKEEGRCAAKARPSVQREVKE